MSTTLTRKERRAEARAQRPERGAWSAVTLAVLSVARVLEVDAYHPLERRPA